MSNKFAILKTVRIDSELVEVVDNIIVATTWPSGIQVDDVEGIAIGWHYVNGVFSAPPEPLPTELPRFITTLAFNGRFTTEELVHLKLVAVINPTAVVEEQRISAQVSVYKDKLDMAKYIDLKDPRTLSGLQDLEYLGVLAVGRAQEIIDAPIEDFELP